MPKYMLMRNVTTRKPVTYTTVPVAEVMAELIRRIGDPGRCEVKTVDLDGSRESLAAAFRDNEGWRDVR